jgi:hypothetical protein
VASVVVTHPFVSAKAESSDGTKVRASTWNAAHAFTGGSTGKLLARDTGQTNGAAWVEGLPWVNVKDYGAVGDGTTDDSNAVINAIAAAVAAGGGTIYFPTGTYRITSQLVIPNDGGSPPYQKPIRLLGAGAHYSPLAHTPNGGSILDLRSTTSPAKIETLGFGLLEITGLTLEDTTDGTTDFIHTTNTTLFIKGVSFYGKTAIAPTQDAIVMGGTVAHTGGASTDGFQGYGTVIDANFFQKIRRGVYGKTYTNGIVVTNNSWWTQCGGAAAIESDGAGDNNAGWYISGNLIEETNYTYAIKLTKSNGFVMVGNNFYDATGTTTAHYRFEAAAYYNTIVSGFHDDTKTAVSEDAAVAGRNSYLNAHQSQTSLWAQPWTFSNATVTFANSAGSGPLHQDTSGNVWYARLNQADGSRYYFKYIPSGGSGQDILYLQHFSDTDYRVNILGSADNSIRASNQLRVYASAGQPLSLGDATNKITITSGVIATGFQITFTEMTAPSAPAANKVHLYAEDNGAGKTRLMALFPTGAAQQVAIEP